MLAFYLIDTFSQSLKPVHVDDSGGHGDHDAQDRGTQTAAAGNFYLKK